MASGDCSVETQPPSTAGGLGYSRHYAQRIRDLGQTSKDSWIKRLWNHMFGSSSVSNKKISVTTKDALSGDSGKGISNKRAGDHVHEQSLSSDRPSSSHGRLTEISDVRKLHPTVSHDKHEIVAVATPRQIRSSHELAGKAMPLVPPQLINSPYLPPREKVVFYRPTVAVKPGSSSRHDGITAAKMRYEKLSKSSTALQSSSSGSDTNENMHKSSSSFAIKRQYKRDTATLQMEKRAKAVADRAIVVCINLLFTQRILVSKQFFLSHMNSMGLHISLV